MASIEAIDNAEEWLVLRVDQQSAIMQILYYNEKIRRMAKRMIGKKISSIGLKQTIYQQCEVHLTNVFRNMKRKTFQLYIAKRYYQISYLPEKTSQGQVETVLAIVRDVTKEQDRNAELMINQAKLYIAQKIAMVGYFENDMENDILYWSDQQYRNFGYSPNEVIPTRDLFYSHIHPEDQERTQTALVRLQEKSYVESQFRVIRVDGTEGWLYYRMNIIMDERGGRTKLVGITQDITEQKQAEERIHRVEKELAFTNQLYSRSAYLNRLLFDHYPTDQISKALTDFGINIQTGHCCFILQLAENLAYNAVQLAEKNTPTIVKKQAVLLWLAERGWGLAWGCHDNIAILVSMEDHMVSNKQSQIQLANDLANEINGKFPDFYVNIGISGISGIPMNFCEIYQKAHRAVVIAGLLDCSSIIHGDDTGLYEVAFQLLQDENTCKMVENSIGRLAAYDANRGSNLLTTLECILEHVSLKTVAQKLFVHHNTVVWRKRKIEMFLAMPLDKMETKMLLLLYIKIWNLGKRIW